MSRLSGSRGHRGVRFGHFLVLLLAAALCGCGGPTKLPAQGYVSFSDGEPVKNGRIEFRSIEGNYRGMGTIDSAGFFRLLDDNGVEGIPAGDYEVIVVQIIMTDHLSLEAHNHGRPVPRRYADYYSSGLTQQVSAENASNLKVVIEPK